MTVEELLEAIVDLASKDTLDPHEEELLHEYRKHLPDLKPFFSIKEQYEAARERYLKLSGSKTIPRNRPTDEMLARYYDEYLDIMFRYTDELRKKI